MLDRSTFDGSRSWLAQWIRSRLLWQVRHYLLFVTERVFPSMSLDSIEAEAESFADVQSNSGDPELAWNRGLDHFLSMSDIRQSLINLTAVGLSHLFEQQLRHFLEHAHLVGPEQRVFYNDYKNRLSEVGFPVEDAESWACIQELRHAANVVKHAEGDSAERLRKIRRDLYSHPQSVGTPIWDEFGFFEPEAGKPMTGDGIYIEEDDLRVWAKAIESLWENMADRLVDS